MEPVGDEIDESSSSGNHVESNHVDSTVSSEDKDLEGSEAFENGTSSSTNTSNPASKSSSLIKLKYEYSPGKEQTFF